MATFPDTLLTGHPLLDRQHKEIFLRLGELLDSAMTQTSQYEIEKFLNFLVDYVKEHFKEEEALMAMVNYPDMKSHQGEHVTFDTTIGNLVEEFRRTGKKEIVYVQTVSVCGGWLREHINRTDRLFVVYLRERTATKGVK